MRYEGICIIGEKESNYEDLIDRLCLNYKFKLVKLYSDSNSHSNMIYMSRDDINHIKEDKILHKWQVYESTYVIGVNEYKKQIELGYVPIIMLPEELFFPYKETVGRDALMSIYVYKHNNINFSDNEKNKQFDLLNKYFTECTYCINNRGIANSCELIKKVWDFQEVGGGLSKDYILKMLRCDLLICDGNEKNVSNASYDLRLGKEYYYAGKINELDEKNPFLAIEPYDYVIASCEEKIVMPRDVSARFDVSVNLFCQGIILSNSTQVDPGFKGKLFCLLFNTSNKVVYLKMGMHYATLEFSKLIEPTTAYIGKYANKNSIVPYLPPNVMHGAINELKKEIEKLKAESQKMQSIYLSVLALFLAIVSILLVFK